MVGLCGLLPKRLVRHARDWTVLVYVGARQLLDRLQCSVSDMFNELTGMNYRMCWLLAACICVPAFSQPAARGDSVRIQMDVLEDPLPTYPTAAIESRREGLVSLEVTISPEGKVSGVVIREAFDEEAGNIAQKTVRNWKYIVTTLDGPAARLPRIGPVIFRYVLSADGPRVLNTAAEMASQLKKKQGSSKAK